MVIIKEFFLAGISTLLFGVYFNSPKVSLIETAFIGGISWLITYQLNILTENIISSTFFGCVMVGILSEIFSTIKKRPATVYLIPSIIPFVPGAKIYEALLFFMAKNYLISIEKMIEAIGIAVAISFGLIFASFFSSPIRRIRLGRRKGVSK